MILERGGEGERGKRDRGRERKIEKERGGQREREIVSAYERVCERKGEREREGEKERVRGEG